jgi:hypothetical protein
MNALKAQQQLTPALSREDIIETMESCYLCGSKLQFSHRTDYLALQVHEEAKCSQCGIKSKVSSFILQ